MEIINYEIHILLTFIIDSYVYLAMTNNKIKNSSAILLGTIMLTAVFGFANIPQAQAMPVTINFNGLVFNVPQDNYSESGMTVTSTIATHLHGSNNLHNHVKDVIFVQSGF